MKHFGRCRIASLTWSALCPIFYSACAMSSDDLNPSNSGYMMILEPRARDNVWKRLTTNGRVNRRGRTGASKSLAEVHNVSEPIPLSRHSRARIRWALNPSTISLYKPVRSQVLHRSFRDPCSTTLQKHPSDTCDLYPCFYPVYFRN